MNRKTKSTFLMLVYARIPYILAAILNKPVPESAKWIEIACYLAIVLAIIFLDSEGE